MRGSLPGSGRNTDGFAPNCELPDEGIAARNGGEAEVPQALAGVVSRAASTRWRIGGSSARLSTGTSRKPSTLA